MRTSRNYICLNGLVCRPRLNNAYAVGFQREVTNLSVFAAPIKGIRVKAIVQKLSRQIGNGTDAWTCDAGTRGQHLLVDVALPHDTAATWLGTQSAGAVSYHGNG